MVIAMTNTTTTLQTCSDEMLRQLATTGQITPGQYVQERERRKQEPIEYGFPPDLQVREYPEVVKS